MRIERSASAIYELGEIDPSWRTPRLSGDMMLKYEAHSHDQYHRLTHPVPNGIQNLFHARNYEPEELQACAEDLQGVVADIDGMVRDFRDYDDSEKTDLLVDYRSGWGRAATSLTGLSLAAIQASLGLEKGYLFPGATHVDRLGPPENNDKQDMVILSTGGGKPTMAHLGPTYDFSLEGRHKHIGYKHTHLYLARLSRFLMTRKMTVYIRPDVATLINERTIHKQLGQRYDSDSANPGSFLRVVVNRV